MESWGTRRRFAKNLVMARLASPSEGAARISRRSRPVWSNRKRSAAARGLTLTRNVTRMPSTRKGAIRLSLRAQLCSSSRSENCRAHAYQSRSLFYSHFEIVAHAHGELGHPDSRQARRVYHFCKLAQTRKIRAAFFGILKVR